MEILEYLEALAINFTVNDGLIGPQHYSGETIYEIRDNKNEVVAGGGRHDRLVAKMGFRRELPQVEITVYYKKSLCKKAPEKMNKHFSDPAVCYIHLGYEARLKSLPTIEKLRQQGVHLQHFLTEAKCRNQVEQAEKSKPRYLFIMGIKEALENTIVIRDMKSHSQQTISLNDLSRKVKRLKLS